MFTIYNMNNHATYERLMQAAEELKNIAKPATLAREMQKDGISVITQHLNNWRTRGIPENKFLALAKWLGCNPYWLEDGSGEMQTTEYGITRQQKVVLKAMRKMGDDKQDQMVKISDTFVEPSANGTDGH